MPNYGRSGGCLTCKRRRVKCDEARPTCSQCQRLRLGCGGYNKKFSFKDENHKFISADAFRKRNTTAPPTDIAAVVPEPSRSLLTGADVAVPFFLLHSACLGRSLVAARGFLETLIPAYSSQCQDSALSLAVSAVAARVFSMWRHDDNAAANVTYAHAAAAIRTAIECPEQRHRPATALAILAMHLYETISAIYDLRPAMAVHHHGALSLLPVAVSDQLDGLISKYVQNYVYHLEISSALRQKRSVQPNVLSYMTNTGSSTLVPHNISSALDLICMYVAELQARYMRAVTSRQPYNTSEHLSRDCIVEAERIGELLRAWACSIPNHWRPLRLTSGREFSSSIPTYCSACDIYPSCQLASIWNLWRIQRILLLKMTFGFALLSTTSSRDDSASAVAPPVVTTEVTMHADSIQELVDGVCYSVPFYLGNRTKPSSLVDFNDREILFPSYHSLATGSARVAAWRQDGDGTAMLKDEHYSHVIANGAWHAMNPLSSLLTLFSDDCGGRAVASCLRPGQHGWIRKQFLRVGTLLCLPDAGPRGATESFEWNERCNRSSPLVAKTEGTAADYLAERVRKSAMFMGGP